MHQEAVLLNEVHLVVNVELHDNEGTRLMDPAYDAERAERRCNAAIDGHIVEVHPASQRLMGDI